MPLVIIRVPSCPDQNVVHTRGARSWSGRRAREQRQRQRGRQARGLHASEVECIGVLAIRNACCPTLNLAHVVPGRQLHEAELFFCHHKDRGKLPIGTSEGRSSWIAAASRLAFHICWERGRPGSVVALGSRS